MELKQYMREVQYLFKIPDRYIIIDNYYVKYYNYNLYFTW